MPGMPGTDVRLERDQHHGHSEAVLLQPFVHQVGGHASVLRYDETTICKPLDSRELQFYKNAPAALKPFIPEYRGLIDVHLLEDDEGYITLIGCSPPISDNKDNNSEENSSFTSSDCIPLQDQINGTGSKECGSIRLLRSGSIEVQLQTDSKFQMVDPHSGHKTKPTALNPWSIKCHKRTLSNMMKFQEKSPQKNKFILLENVTSKCSQPCILDLKMGTRCHGDEVPEAKKQSHTKRCESTTSIHIGSRLCGMQVYQTTCENYICRNKYYGRDLDIFGFKKELYQFLDNGARLRTELIKPIVDNLRELASRIRELHTFRFYSSSLLIMYDGSTQEVDGDDEKSRDELQNSSVLFSAKENSRKEGVLGPESVSVYMIDFAHTTYHGFYGDKTIHQGADNGYLFGLENLIRLFMEIETEISKM